MMAAIAANIGSCPGTTQAAINHAANVAMRVFTTCNTGIRFFDCRFDTILMSLK
jgi:hypothetical protein